MKIVSLLSVVALAALAALACGEAGPPPADTAPPRSAAPAPFAPASTPAAAAPAAPPLPAPPASPAEVTGESGDITARLALPNLRRICAGQVPQVPRPGAEPVNVLWEAYSSPDDRATLDRHFDSLFGAAIHLEQGACDTWRFPPAKPTSLLQICSPTLQGPWSSCGPAPAGTGAVLVVSETTAELAP